ETAISAAKVIELDANAKIALDDQFVTVISKGRGRTTGAESSSDRDIGEIKLERADRARDPMHRATGAEFELDDRDPRRSEPQSPKEPEGPEGFFQTPSRM